MSIVKTLIVVVVKKYWPLFQLDVNNSFLHGDLDEEVFMKLPPGLTVPPSSSSFSSSSSSSYSSSSSSAPLVCKLQKDSLVILAVYVDDIILTGCDLDELVALKSFLNNQFKIKDLGSLNYFLGIELKAKVGTPLPRPEEYMSLVGKLNFLTHTRPDLSFGVQHLCQFMQPPCVPHMQTALHFLRYLKGASNFGIFLNNSPDLSLQLYCDSDWASCPNSRRSVTSFCIFLGEAW
ncbi:uncharacterized mitochondrial protein AtMg00810-like [Nicotiana tomentosiformis]|uniref:uncharacterized mitochondrial protein AtMg00810-like n=1 Tax=Nicotiana tomentosiformis TaxID=4098 RepID=UPI00388CB836